MPPSVTGFSRKSFQVFTGDVCQVTQTLTSSVMLPSQANFVPSYGCARLNSGSIGHVRPNVPNALPSFGAAG